MTKRKPTMSDNFGYKRTVVGAHYGLRDWLSQRVTAVLMALFTLILLALGFWRSRFTLRVPPSSPE